MVGEGGLSSMRLWQHLLVNVLKKAAIVFGAILILTGFLVALNEYRIRTWYGSFPFVSGIGTVRYMDFEGGFWGIIADDGGHYDLSMSDNSYFEDFHVEGLRVGFEGYLVPARSYHMWGHFIVLTDIWKI